MRGVERRRSREFVTDVVDELVEISDWGGGCAKETEFHKGGVGGFSYAPEIGRGNLRS